ncbi:response regulator transcription factor [Sphingomonas sp. 3-13AW]|jgi:two-component system response regulator FixJ|uniref:response regulator transcription factor n=1 Tax=Sphingomonas sp. 3-13AW TaxID=3050450 RepID=UPI003BB61AFE
MLVYVVDDDSVSRRAIGMTVQRLGYSVKYFSSGLSLIEEEYLEPGCILLDLCMPDASGNDVLEALYDRHCPLPVVIITGLSDIGAVVRAMKLGALDVLIKPLQTDALASAIQQSSVMLKRNARRHDVAEQAERRLQCLTPRERDVLSGLAKGLPNKTIGYDLGISSRTVEIHRAHLMAKLDVHSLSELLRIVYDAESDGARGTNV